MKLSKLTFGLLVLTFLSADVCKGQNLYDTLRTVKMTALADQESIQLSIQWLDDPGANIYSLYKKNIQDTNWGDPLIITGDQDTSYLDTDIVEGGLYEYRIIKQTGDSLGYAYLFSGVNYDLPQKRGDILLLVEAAAVDLVNENLTTYSNILISEGWIPWLVPVAEEATVEEVKSLVLQYYTTVDSLTAVVLMGNIAVPHSGNINPDGHSNHKGGWPADLYYGDVDGIWTDETVNNISSAYPLLHNIPGDGNFDQDYIPGEIELAIGRLDFSELPIFEMDQYELLNNYLQKNIAYRTGVYRARRRAVFRNRNPWVEGLGQNAIRNFVPLVGSDSLVYVDYLDAFNDSYLWCYGGSSGSMTCSNGFGCIDLYADNNFQATFTANFGSYFGDYDFENNYLRTILASGQVLSAAWVGAPNWYFHPMGMGFDLGACTVLTQNNSDLYYAGVFPQSITINLLGDPTLKAFIVLPPHDLIGTQDGNQIALSWLPSQDDILGYQVYKRNAGDAYFEAINPIPISATNLVDSCVVGGGQTQYLVKALKREITPSGSFINYSSGPIISMTTQSNILPEAHFDLSWDQGVLSGTNLSINADQYHWILPGGEPLAGVDFEIPYQQNGVVNVTLIATNDCFSDTLQQAFVITDVANLSSDKDIKVYPNPAKDFLTVETTIQIDQLAVYNVLGTSVLRASHLAAGTHTISIQSMVAGSYVLKIHHGDQVMTKMIYLR